MRREGLPEGHQDWLEALADEPDAEDWVQRAAYPEGRFEFEDEPWHGLYWEAWNTLRFDRQYLSSMAGYAGEFPISYGAIRAYADDNGIVGHERWVFRNFMNAIDAEWLKHVAARSKGKEG